MLRFLDIFPEYKSELQNFKVHLAIGRIIKKEPLIALSKNIFQEWQEYQNNKNFERKFILSLVFLKPNEWLFAGLYRSLGCRKTYDNIRKKEYYKYKTELIPKHADLIKRAVFQFTNDFRQSYILLEKHYEKIDLNEVFIKPYKVESFPGFENVVISFETLKERISEEEVSWKTALSSVKGVYLIIDCHNGKQYIGSAYGEEAFWNRWASYAENGHGNNIEIKRIIEKYGIEYSVNFQFSILEIRAKITDDQEIINREAHWKRMLRTREFGYNEN